jgi:hypothetical protein
MGGLSPKPNKEKPRLRGDAEASGSFTGGTCDGREYHHVDQAYDRDTTSQPVKLLLNVSEFPAR